MKIDAINIITKLGVISRKDIMFIVEHEINYDTIFFIEKSLLGIYLQISVYYENSIITPSMVTYSILIHNSDSQ
jgi:hypothetical protein